MEIIPLIKKFEEWDEICLDSDDAWFWHSSMWIEHTLIPDYKPELNTQSLCFMVKRNNKTVAIVPLFLEEYTLENKKYNEFTMKGEYIPSPALVNGLSKKERKNILDFIFRHIDELAIKQNVSRSKIRIPPLAPASLQKCVSTFNFLMRYGYIDSSLNTQIIDLNKSLEMLRLDFTHGHDSAVDKAAKHLKLFVFSKDNITWNVFNQHVQMHHKVTERLSGNRKKSSVRPLRSYEMWYEMICKGYGVLLCAEMITKPGYFIGGSYLHLYKKDAAYSCSRNDPDFERDIPIGQFIQWNAIKWLKENDFNFYETGLQQFGPLPYNLASNKEINIGRFKKGFGGETYPLFSGEKYYSKEFYLKVNEKRIKDFANLVEINKNR